MTKIYLIRHAETKANSRNVIQGWWNTRLSERGKLQVEALARRFAAVEIDAVYSSDLLRAKASAEPIAKLKGLPLRLDRNLREINMGLWAGRSWNDLVKNDHERIVLFETMSPEWRGPEGESFGEARARICGALREIAERHRGQSVAVVSHGAVIRQALAATKGLSIQETKSEILGPNTCVALLEFDGDAFRIVFQSDVSHLGAMEAAASICP